MKLSGTLFVMVLAAGCGDNKAMPAATESPDAPQASADAPPVHPSGKLLYESGTFGGNGATCTTCHSPGTGTISPGMVQQRFAQHPDDPLFQHDRADTMDGDTFDRLQANATILVTIPLPANVSIVGSDARAVTLARGIPTTLNTPALDPVLMQDGRQPDLSAQAKDAIANHAQGVATDAEAGAIAEFERTLFSRDNLRAYVADGTPLVMPLGTTDAEKRGRKWFIADGETDPGMVGEDTNSVCGWCHSGPFLNSGSAYFGANIAPNPIPEGARYFSVRVSEFNTLGNPTYTWQVKDPTSGTVLRTATSPDPGTVLITGNNAQFNAFKSPTLWGVADTAPYFHDNSAKTMEEMMTHYAAALTALSTANPKVGRIINLTDQDKADIIAYMKLL